MNIAGIIVLIGMGLFAYLTFIVAESKDKR